MNGSEVLYDSCQKYLMNIFLNIISESSKMNFLSGLFRGSRSLKMKSLPNIGAVCEEHHVNKNSMFEFPENTKSVMVGMGCFWGVERLFWKQDGVYSTQGTLISYKKGSFATNRRDSKLQWLLPKVITFDSKQ